MRQEASMEDQRALNMRKEIYYEDKLVNEQKEINHNHFQEINRLREI